MIDGLAAFWMPFTDNRRFKNAPRMLVSAEGMYYRDAQDRLILDAAAGLWCVNAGHRRPEIGDAIIRQYSALDYAPSFQIGHPIAFEFAERLTRVLPSGFDHIFFGNSGSEAVESALKIALAYQAAIGEGRRTRLIGRERAYHGVGFAGISVGGIVNNRRGFGPLLPGVDHLRHTHDPQTAFTRGQPLLGAKAALDLERLIALHGAETIAAVIVEPIAGSTGVLVPPCGYLEQLQEIARAHGILLIFDEVITGFGRTGSMTAAQQLGVTPDILVLAKGLTNGAVPMGAVAVRTNIHNAIVEGAGPGIELFHGYTCSGHPLAAAAGLATIGIFEEDQLCHRASAFSQPWEDALHSLRDARHVIDIRNYGLIGGIEMAPRPDAAGQRGAEVHRACLDDGVLIRTTGDTIALSPPLIINEEQIEQIVGTIRRALACID